MNCFQFLIQLRRTFPHKCSFTGMIKEGQPTFTPTSVTEESGYLSKRGDWGCGVCVCVVGLGVRVGCDIKSRACVCVAGLGLRVGCDLKGRAWVCVCVCACMCVYVRG